MIGVLKDRSIRMAAALALTAVLLAGCVTPRPPVRAGGGEPHYKIGQPYKVNGRWYYPREDPDYEAVGLASWYGDQFHGRRTANGEVFDMNRMSAAHTTLPLPSLVEVTNLKNGRRTIVRVNDRGPFVGDRIIDLSKAAAKKLDYERDGVTRVRVRYLGRAQLAAVAPSPDGRMTRSAGLQPVLAALIPDDGADAITRLIAASATEELTEGAKAFVLAEAEAAVQSTPAPAPSDNMAPPAQPAEIGDGQAASSTSGADSRSGLDEFGPSAARADAPVPIASAPAGVQIVQTLYAVQIAVFSNLNNLEATKLALNGLGALRIAKIEGPQGDLYRVRLGPFPDRGSAAVSLAAVRDAGYGDAQIVTITP